MKIEYLYYLRRRAFEQGMKGLYARTTTGPLCEGDAVTNGDFWVYVGESGTLCRKATGRYFKAFSEGCTTVYSGLRSRTFTTWGSAGPGANRAITVLAKVSHWALLDGEFYE